MPLATAWGLGSQRDGDARVWRFTRRRPGPGPSDDNGAGTQSEPARAELWTKLVLQNEPPTARFDAQVRGRRGRGRRPPRSGRSGPRTRSWTGCRSGRSGSRPPAATSA